MYIYIYIHIEYKHELLDTSCGGVLGSFADSVPRQALNVATYNAIGNAGVYYGFKRTRPFLFQWAGLNEMTAYYYV